MKNNIYIVLLLLVTSVNSQSLNDYLKLAVENNPELAAVEFKYDSALEKVVEVGSLPNTAIGASYFVQEPETRVGAQKAKFSVVQKLPWFGTLEAKKASAALIASSKLDEVEIFRRELILNVKLSYFKLYELKRQRALVQENIEILKNFESLALNELANNRSTMVEVLKIRMEKNTLVNQLNSIDQNILAEETAFNLLLNRSEDLEVQIVSGIDDLMLQEDFSKDLINENPKLGRLENIKNALGKSELAAKKEGLPNIGLGLDYVLVDTRNVENLIDNGKDIIMPMVSVSIPLFSKKYSSKQKQLQLEQQAVDSNLKNTKNNLVTAYEKAVYGRMNAKSTIQTQELNIEEVDKAKNVLLATYETGSVDFDQLLEIQQLKLKFQFIKVSSEKDFAIQTAKLAYLTKNN